MRTSKVVLLGALFVGNSLRLGLLRDPKTAFVNENHKQDNSQRS